MISTTARQIELGEFGDHYGEFARTVSAEQFADYFGTTVCVGPQLMVTIDGIDYYWSAKSRKYDGWGRVMRS